MAFDLDEYTRRAGRLDTTDLDLEDGFRAEPLDPDVLRCLRYMHDIESHTACYLRDMLVTKAHRDPDITTFLTLWSFEEHWHGDAIAKVLAAHDRIGGRPAVAEVRAAQGRFERWRPLAFMLGSALLPDITAIHLTWGAINEWTTQAGYARLASRSGHPLLGELLRRIMRQEGMHIDFYSTEASKRLASSVAARRTTAFALRHAWQPVGTGVRPQAETDFVVRYLFAGEEGAEMAARIDRRVDRLPGLAGLGLVRSAREAALARP